MSIELRQAAQQALKALEAISDEMTVGERYTNAGQYLLEALGPLRAALSQQPATGEPVYWEWRHLSSHPDTVDFGQWSEWKRVEARSAIHTIDDALAEFRAYIAQGYKYELRPLYTHPAPSVPADVVRDAERYRWLRQHQLLAKINYMPTPSGEDLDAAIDAAMLAAKEK